MHSFLKIIFEIKPYIRRKVLLSIIRRFSLYTQQWYMSYRFALCAPDGGQRNCPKHVEFYSKNKIEKLVLLVSVIIRIHILLARKIISSYLISYVRFAKY
jgi:hypothetical protein